MTYILNPDGSYMSADQIVADLHTRVTEADTLEWLKGGMGPNKGESPWLASYQRGGFHRWLRNSYGLWAQDNPQVVLDAPPNDKGVIDHLLFPDNLSAAIVNRFMAECSAQSRWTPAPAHAMPPPPQVDTAPEPQWLKDRLDDHAHVGGMHPDDIRKEPLASKAERGAGWTPIKALGRDAMARDNGDGTRTVRYCEPVLGYSYQADGDGMCTIRRREDSPSHTYHALEELNAPPVEESVIIINLNIDITIEVY